MIELVHQAEPGSLTRFRNIATNSLWGDLPWAVKEDIHAALEQDQERLCVYCEVEISVENRHLEHLKPKSRYPSLTFDYRNLALSCNSRDHCGHKKGKKEIPLLPEPDCNRDFQVSLRDGKLLPKENLNTSQKDDVVKTIHILGLNSPDLTRRRWGYIQTIIGLSEADGDAEEYMQDQPFRHILKEVWF